MSVERDVTGGCLCGAVRYTATVPDWHSACFCKMCQRWSSGTFMGVPATGFELTEGADLLTVFRSSDWAERAFCGTCGSNLWYRATHKAFPSLALGSLDDTDGMRVAYQFYADRVPGGAALADPNGRMTEAETVAHFTGGSDG